MQRVASVTAPAAARPRFTSLKLCARISASSSGMRTREICMRCLRGIEFASDMALLPLRLELGAQLRCFLFPSGQRDAHSGQLLLLVQLKRFQRDAKSGVGG